MSYSTERSSPRYHLDDRPTMSGLQCIIVDVNGGWTLHHPKSKKGLRQGSALTTDTGGRLLKHPARPYRSSESYDDGLLTPMFARPTSRSL